MTLLRRTPLAWLNLVHDRRKLLTSLGGVTFAVLLMFMFSGFKNALYDSQVQLLSLLNADIIMTSKLKYTMFIPEAFARRRLYQAQAFAGVETVYPLYTNNANWKNPKNPGAVRPVRALAFNLQDPVLPMAQLMASCDPKAPALSEAEIQRQLAGLRLPNTVLVDCKSRSELGEIRVGVVTELSKRQVRVVGSYSLGTDFAAGNGNLLMSDQNFLRYFAELGPEDESRTLNTVDIGLIKIAAGTNADRLVETLGSHLPNDVIVMTKDAFVKQELKYWRENTQIGFVFTLLTGMGFVVGIILVYQILYTDVADHWAEYATLKAMGYTNIFLLGVVLQEAAILSALGFIPGCCLSVLLYHLTANATGLLMQMTTGRAVFTYGLTFVMCLISGAIAVRKVQTTDPAEVFG